MSKIYETIDSSIETLFSTLKRFPLASFSALLLSIIYVLLLEYQQYNTPNGIILSKLMFVLSITLVLFPALQLLSRSFVLPLLGLIALGIYYYSLPPSLDIYYYFFPVWTDSYNETILARHVLIGLAFFFMIFWAPFIFRKSDNETFWQYAQSIIFGLITAILFSFIIYASLSAGVFAIEKLFKLHITLIFYEQIAIIVFGIFGVNFFLSQIPKHPLFMEVRPYSKIKRIFTKNILTPLTIVYFTLLFGYSIKILLTMVWPEGTFSWMIVTCSSLVILSFLFLTPYLKKSYIIKRFIWLTVLLQSIMLGMLLWIRVEEYGITYNRYLLAIFAVYLLLMSLYFIFFKKAQLKWLFFFASIFILFSQFGSYSAKKITLQSQTARLIKLIETTHPRSEELEMKKKYAISQDISYMNTKYGIDIFEKILPTIVKKYKASHKLAKRKEYKYSPKTFQQIYYSDSDNSQFPSFATKELGFNYTYKSNNKYYQLHDPIVYKNELDWFSFTNKSNLTKISGYDYLLHYHSHNLYYKEEPTLDTDFNLSIQINKHILEIHHENKSVKKFDLKPYTQKLFKEKNSTKLYQDMEVKNYIYQNEHIKIKVTLHNITLLKDGNISSLFAKILLKYKEQ